MLLKFKEFYIYYHIMLLFAIILIMLILDLINVVKLFMKVNA